MAQTVTDSHTEQDLEAERNRSLRRNNGEGVTVAETRCGFVGGDFFEGCEPHCGDHGARDDARKSTARRRDETQ